jgi:hypothetical protein
MGEQLRNIREGDKQMILIILGGILGLVLGALLSGGMVAVAGLPVYGPASSIVVAILASGLVGAFMTVLKPIVILFSAGFALLVATIFVYVGSAVSLLGVAPGPGGVIAPPPGERFCRGILIGMASSVNFLVLSAIPALSWLGIIVFIVTLLALIPPVAGNRFYQRVLGALGWILPMNYLMLPLGILLFLIAAPAALAAPGGGVRWDWLTWTVETRGGVILGTFATGGGFNVGNFTFIRPGVPTSPAFTSTVSAHETGHTLSNSAFGGFVYWIGAVDENVPPLARMSLAYTELLAEGHFNGPTGGPDIPMW